MHPLVAINVVPKQALIAVPDDSYCGPLHLIVARRQKHQGMHWSEQTSDSLAALRTLMLNGGWDLYWQKHQALPLTIQVST
jgi:hypothetical protein